MEFWLAALTEVVGRQGRNLDFTRSKLSPILGSDASVGDP